MCHYFRLALKSSCNLCLSAECFLFQWKVSKYLVSFFDANVNVKFRFPIFNSSFGNVGYLIGEFCFSFFSWILSASIKIKNARDFIPSLRQFMDKNEEIQNFLGPYENSLLKLGPKILALKWRDEISTEGLALFGKPSGISCFTNKSSNKKKF